LTEFGDEMPETSAPRKPGLAVASGVALLVAMALFAFYMSPRGSNKIGGCVAALALLGAVMAAGMAMISLLLPRESKVEGGMRGVAVMALMVASVLIAANGIPLLIAWFDGCL